MSDRNYRLRLGFFVLVALLLLAGLIALFGGAPSWFLKRNEYTIVFSDAPGISPGTPIRKSGVKVGEVGGITLDDATGEVHIQARLDPKFRPRTSEEPIIGRGLLAAETSIDFVPKETGKPQPGEPIAPGSVIRGVTPVNARQLLAQAADVIPAAEQSLNQIRLSMQQLERISPQIENTFKEVGELARASKEFVPELRRGVDDLRDVFARSKGLGPELIKTNEELRYFLRTASVWTENVGLMLKTNEPRLQTFVDSATRALDETTKVLNDENRKNFAELLKNTAAASTRFERIMDDVQRTTGPLGERAPRVFQNIESSSDQLTRTLLEVRDLLRQASQSDGSFQRFLADPSFYQNLDAAAAGLARMMPRLDRVLRDLEVFADKIARHPESLGVGGAVRPSAGLKESPTAPLFRPQP